MKTIITTIKFYPYKTWFWYFKKNKYLKGFTLRIFGVNIRRQEKDALEKLIYIGKMISILKQNGIKYKHYK